MLHFNAGQFVLQVVGQWVELKCGDVVVHCNINQLPDLEYVIKRAITEYKID